MTSFKDTRLRRRLADAKYTAMNVLNSLTHPIAFYRGFIAIEKLKSKLKSLAGNSPKDNGDVPNVVHFVWGLAGTAEPFPYYAYIAVASALFYNPGAKVFFHFGHEPSGEFWKRIKSKVTLNQIDDFEYFGIARINHFAHKADVVRLLALDVVGGIYLDCDTLTAKSFESLLTNKAVMGVQASYYDASPGLCNATVLSPPRHAFVKRWLRKYRSFYSIGRDGRWDYHSVKIPGLLSFYHPHEVVVLPFDRFFYPLWTDLPRVLLRDDARKWLPHLDSSFSFHLWNTINKSELDGIDDEFVKNSKSVYAHFAMPAIAGDVC